MAKQVKPEPIGELDMLEYVEEYSDFAFELSVYKFLDERGFDCEHGGTYQDPITGKHRQFDIRATWTSRSYPNRLRLAVECKQIQPNFPLLVLHVPRLFDEGFHDLIVTDSKNRLGDRQATQIPVQGRCSIYNEGEYVGKSCAQVGRDQKGMTGTDSEVFGKWTQAINSAYELVKLACKDQAYNKEGYFVTLILPIVVVPDERLWSVEFSSDGTRLCDPKQVDRCSYFVNVHCRREHHIDGLTYTFSHLEFVTMSGLKRLLAMLTSDFHHRTVFDPKEVRRRLGLDGPGL